ncbi:MAG: glycerophosphodiester phosphodiesterase [Gemmataceae bacterium]|nr:glycerophosphodiester phosphodiesterase [Gemmataceae bacterium]
MCRWVSWMAVMAMATNAQATEIIAHRGASYEAPENTVAALKLAWKQSADASEFDCMLSKDGKIVVIHDFDTKRTAGLDRKVIDQTLAELRTLDAGKWKSADYLHEKIPTLKEMLDVVPAGKRLFIEIKCGVEIMPEFLRVLKERDLPPEKTAVISFHYNVVAAVKKARPDIKAYWIVSLRSAKGKEPPTAEDLIAKAKAANLDGLDLSASPILDAAFAKKVRDAALGLYVWTVNDAAEARRLVGIGVDGITTDRPGWLREQLDKKP